MSEPAPGPRPDVPQGPKPVEKVKPEAEKIAKEIEKFKSDWEKLPEKLKPEKELKSEKPEIKEHKLEVKEKEHKLEVKEKEHKLEVKEKEHKPEFEKPPVPEKGIKEAEVPQRAGPLPIDREALLRHAEALESMGRDLRHFIEQSERPDLTHGALRNEPDQQDEAGT